MRDVNLSSIQSTWKEKFKIDLVNNKKEFLFVNVLSFVVMILMAIPLPWMMGFLEKGMDALMDIKIVHGLLLFVLCFVYIGAHEAVHGITMKCFSSEKVDFGWKVVYAYAGSKTALFNPKEYIAVAMAPVVFFGILFTALMFLFPSMMVVFYLLNIINVSGASGDLYVTCRMLKYWNSDLLVNDTGTDMTVYEKA